MGNKDISIIYIFRPYQYITIRKMNFSHMDSTTTNSNHIITKQEMTKNPDKQLYSHTRITEKRGLDNQRD